MNFRKATNEQLKVLFSHEWNIPTETMKDIVYENCNRRLLDGFIVTILNHLNMQVNDDLIQQGYLHMIEGIRRYKPSNNSFSTFIYRLIISRFLNYKRDQFTDKRKSNQNNLYLDAEIKTDEGNETFLSMLQDNSVNVERQVIEKITIERILNELSDKQKEVILWRLMGYKMTEIASHLNISHTAVKYRIVNARGKIGEVVK